MISARNIARAAATIPVVVALSAAGTLVAEAAPPTLFGSSGSAFGSNVTLGNLVRSGPTAPVGRCTTQEGVWTNRAAGVNLGLAGSLGAVNTRLSSDSSGTTRKTTALSRTGAINLLGGAIRADGITARAITEYNGSEFTQRASNSFADLRIGGEKVSIKPGERTTIDLPAGLGKVVFNAQSKTSKNGRNAISVTAMQVTVNRSEVLGLPSGRIVVGKATSALQEPVRARPYGSAYATKADVIGGTIKSGPTTTSSLPCAGSAGEVIENSTAGVNVAGVLNTGAATSSATSTDNSNATTATTRASIADVSLLGGVVELEGIEARARAVKQPGHKLATSSSGTRVADLKINGESVNVSTRENNKIDIAGVGTLWLRKTVRSGSQIQVYAVQLELLKSQGGLDAGTTINIGYARAGVANR